MALSGAFDVVVHGCNCMCVQRRGLAKQMNEAFGTNNQFCFPLEARKYKGDYNKLGNIQYNRRNGVVIVNAYTQYSFGTQKRHLDYLALALCLKKINKLFWSKHIGIPQIGCGLAGGDWKVVSRMIKRYLKDCKVTIIIHR